VNLVRCIISCNFICDKKFHEILCLSSLALDPDVATVYGGDKWHLHVARARIKLNNWY